MTEAVIDTSDQAAAAGPGAFSVFRKRDFRLTGDLAKAQTEVQNSRDRLLDAAAKAKANA